MAYGTIGGVFFSLIGVSFLRTVTTSSLLEHIVNCLAYCSRCSVNA